MKSFKYSEKFFSYMKLMLPRCTIWNTVEKDLTLFYLGLFVVWLIVPPYSQPICFLYFSELSEWGERNPRYVAGQSLI